MALSIRFLLAGGLATVAAITRVRYPFFLKPVAAAALPVWFLNADLTAWQMLAIFP